VPAALPAARLKLTALFPTAGKSAEWEAAADGAGEYVFRLEPAQLAADHCGCGTLGFASISPPSVTAVTFPISPAGRSVTASQIAKMNLSLGQLAKDCAAAKLPDG